MMYTKSLCISALGIFLIVIGITIVSSRNYIYNLILTYITIIQPGSFEFRFWQTPPVDLRLYVYFFNWTNPEDITNLSTKPNFEQVGPYTFKEHRERVNITWHDNQTVSFRTLRYWQFDESSSTGNLSDVITTLNTVILSAANQVKEWSPLMISLFSYLSMTLVPDLHIRKTIGELFFDGYQDTFIDLANALPSFVDTLPPAGKMGYMYGRNNSVVYEGIFNMNNDNRGKHFGEVLSWNYKNKTDFYEGSCSNITSSVGDTYSRDQTRTHISFFFTDACRPLKLDYEADVEVKGVTGYKYSAQDGVFDNGTKLAQNKCYCNGQCVPSGMINVSSCRFGTPSFISLPHFYNADPYYLNLVNGLAPEKLKHELYMILEPKTGLPLDGNIRIQVNFRLFPIEDIWLFSNVPTIFFPVFWFEQGATAPDFLVDPVTVFLYVPNTILPIVGCMFIGLGIFLLLLHGTIFKRTIKWGKLKYKAVNTRAENVKMESL